MGAAALIGVVDEKGVAFLDVVIFADHCLAAGGEGADMQRQHHMLGHHIAISVHDGAGGVLALAHDGGIARAEQGILHFLHDAIKACLDDLEFDRIELVFGWAAHVRPLRW